LKLVVLDDVLTTVDAGHRLRVARLLAREFEDYQFIITTHDQLWAKELERAIPNTRLVQLRKWNLEQGVDCQQNILSDWEYYEQQALNGRPQDTIAGAGRNLEKFLSQMRGNLGLKVPAKRDRNYTIGDLYNPFFAWVNKSQLERADRPEFAAELEALWKELDEVWRLRNWSGAHFNEWAATVTPDEALSFLDAIKRLVTSFECPVCSNLVVYDSNAKVVICPYCEPSPPPHAVSEYEPDWHDKIIRLLQVAKKKVRRNVVPMAQGVCQSFLRDMRRRLDFPLLATPDDQYTMAQLYAPFFEWAAAHPRPELPDWQQAIEERKQALDTYWQGDQWVDVPDAELESFVEAVQGLTTLFECSTCSQLLNYNHEQEAYFCAECRGQPTIPSKVSAYWFVKRN
jgi:DNA-directed RNA polymerase subunit RPC12/RpoP